MSDSYPDVLVLRVPASMRSALDDEAQARGVKLSAATRAALTAGLQVIRARASNDQPDGPAPAGPAAAMRSAA